MNLAPWPFPRSSFLHIFSARPPVHSLGPGRAFPCRPGLGARPSETPLSVYLVTVPRSSEQTPWGGTRGSWGQRTVGDRIFPRTGPRYGSRGAALPPTPGPRGESLGLESSGPVPTRGSRQDADGDSLRNGFLTLSRSTLAGAARR